MTAFQARTSRQLLRTCGRIRNLRSGEVLAEVFADEDLRQLAAELGVRECIGARSRATELPKELQKQQQE